MAELLVSQAASASETSTHVPYREACNRAQLAGSEFRLPDRCKWAAIKPQSASGLTLSLDVVETIINGTNVFYRAMMELLLRRDPPPTLSEAVGIFSDLTCWTRESIRKQLYFAKMLANAPGSAQLARDVYGRLYNPTNPTAVDIVKRDLDMVKIINDITIQQAQLQKGKGGNSGGGGGGGARHKDTSSSSRAGSHGQAQRGGRSGRGHSATASAAFPSSGSGAPSAAAPAGQQ